MRWESLRQYLLFPSEFRIPRPEGLEEFSRQLDDLKRLLDEKQRTPAALDQPRGAAGGSAIDPAALADMCTGLWRLRSRMVKPGTNEPLETMRREYRHLDSAFDALQRASVQIIDHTDEIMPEGGNLAVKTLAFQPTPGISRERVVETIKPSVYLDGQMIQMGEVIVGVPPEQNS